jgi:hypothetical protein
MGQIGRNLTDAVDGILVGKRYLIHDRDPLFTAEFLSMLTAAGVKSVKLPPRTPNLNAYAERFVRSIKESCLERIILFGESSLRKAIHEFLAHYLLERNHQGVPGELIESRGDWSLVQPSRVPPPLVRIERYWCHRSVNSRFWQASFQPRMCSLAIIVMLKIEQLRLEIGGRPE